LVGLIERLQRRGKGKRFYTTAILRYSGNNAWRIGLKPRDGKLEWIEQLPFEEVLRIVSTLENGMRRTEVKEDG
jgi:hypothetical protein